MSVLPVTILLVGTLISLSLAGPANVGNVKAPVLVPTPAPVPTVAPIPTAAPTPAPRFHSLCDFESGGSCGYSMYDWALELWDDSSDVPQPKNDETIYVALRPSEEHPSMSKLQIPLRTGVGSVKIQIFIKQSALMPNPRVILAQIKQGNEKSLGTFTPGDITLDWMNVTLPLKSVPLNKAPYIEVYVPELNVKFLSVIAIKTVELTEY